MTVKQVLEEALAALRGGAGWQKGGYYGAAKDGGEAFCAIGAILHVTTDKPNGASLSWRREEAKDALLKALPKPYRIYGLHSRIGDFNDHPSRKFASVEKALRKAIESQEA